MVFLSFRFFIDVDRKLFFKTKLLDYAQSTALGEYVLKITRFVSNGQLAAEIFCLKVEKICKFSKNQRFAFDIFDQFR